MEKSAGLVIFHKGNGGTKYLLLHYDAGHWDFPKGHLEEGETDMDAALRELKEETGISGASIIDSFSEKLGYFYRRDGKVIRKEVVFFLAEAKTDEVKLSFEHIGFEWLQFDDALPRITFKNSRDILSKANTFLISNCNNN
ncbi:NUDIX domain-containing protein [Candidatus Woesearchaeota archaeon]|nr:NUDIX domain-containing protein [Candidatus Woesearchaeota archaeon]